MTNFTVDSPVPFDVQGVMQELTTLNGEMVTGSSGREKQGDFHGKLSRLIARLENKLSDRRLGFLFNPGKETMDLEWLDVAVRLLLAGTRDQSDGKGGVKIIDFSEVPSDVLPIMVSLIAKVVLSIQQWRDKACRHPIAVICDEAHNYIPVRYEVQSAEEVSVGIFERIAKEGRKYGVGLVIISQRPSEVNRTVLSQCNNVVSMRLTNAEDQGVIRRLLPDSLGGFAEVLPILDTGEALVVGDASLLPSRIRIEAPSVAPSSGTVDFWDEWAKGAERGGIEAAALAWRRQSTRQETKR